MILKRLLMLGLVSTMLVAGCDDQEIVESQPTPVATTIEAGPITSTEISPTTISVPEATTVPPTLTPSEPMAALVNESPIFLAEFERELARYETAQRELGLEPPDAGYRPLVLDALIERELIAQAASDLGITITSEMVQDRLSELEDASGGLDSFIAWLDANDFSSEEFLVALEGEMLAEKAVEIVTSDVPTEVEQVHARYLQVDDEALARSILDQLLNGADFSEMARQYSLDRMTGEVGGDLGYFAAGSLLVSEVEIEAFSLQPGEISEVVPGTRADGTGLVYYIVETIERDPQRRLTADLRSKLLQDKFESWLEEQWQMAEITRFIDEGG